MKSHLTKEFAAGVAEGADVGVDGLAEEVLVGRGMEEEESAEDGGDEDEDERGKRDVVLERHGRALY
jgi:hypothetical protein